MDITIVVLVLLVGLVLGSAGPVWLIRINRAREGAEREQAIRAAVQTVLVERGATARALAEEREVAGQAAAAMATELAASHLGSRLDAGSRELELRTQTFEHRVVGISDELRRVTELVHTLQQDRALQHGEVVERLTHAVTATAELTSTTSALRDALARPKSRGQWGERMADDVLRAAGFQEGVSYRRQKADPNGRVPDFTFLLPRGLLLNMDVKFPVDNYLRFLQSDNEIEQDRFRSAFAKDVRSRIKELTVREYIDPGRTVDTVLLFIPNEAIYGFIHENDAALLDEALRHKVVLCSPFTLFAVLAVIRQAVENFSLERTGSEILACLNRFNKQWGTFTEALDKVDRSIQGVQTSFEFLNGTRRRALERELGRIEQLQADRGTAEERPDEESPPVPLRNLRAG